MCRYTSLAGVRLSARLLTLLAHDVTIVTIDFVLWRSRDPLAHPTLKLAYVFIVSFQLGAGN
jgi:hypothetical protein